MILLLTGGIEIKSRFSSFLLPHIHHGQAMCLQLSKFLSYLS